MSAWGKHREAASNHSTFISTGAKCSCKEENRKESAWHWVPKALPGQAQLSQHTDRRRLILSTQPWARQGWHKPPGASERQKFTWFNFSAFVVFLLLLLLCPTFSLSLFWVLYYHYLTGKSFLYTFQVAFGRMFSHSPWSFYRDTFLSPISTVCLLQQEVYLFSPRSAWPRAATHRLSISLNELQLTSGSKVFCPFLIFRSLYHNASYPHRSLFLWAGNLMRQRLSGCFQFPKKAVLMPSEHFSNSHSELARTIIFQARKHPISSGSGRTVGAVWPLLALYVP